MLLAMALLGTVAYAQLPGTCGNQYEPDGETAGKAAPANGTCTRQSAIFSAYFRKKENFIPYGPVNVSQNITPQTTIKKVKIRFQVANPGTPTKMNFDQTDTQPFQDIMYWLNNSFFHDTQVPNKPQTNVCGTCYIQDTRIHFELDGVNFFNSTTFSGYTYPDLSNQVIGGDSVLNIFLGYYTNPPFAGITNPQGNIAKFAFHNDVSKNYIVISNAYQRYLQNDLWGVTVLLMHELFHEYGLWHLWDGSETCNEADPDYLKDIFNTGTLKHCPLTGGFNDCDQSNSNYPSFGCNNNVMSIRGYTWTSPMQMGIIHRESFMGRMSQYTFPTEAPSAHPWLVYNDQTWDFGIRMFQDIRVKAGATLTIKCEVQMPPDSRIVVEPGGKLIVDGGLVTSYHGKNTWQGIEVVGNMGQPSSNQYQGALELKNGAIIENAGAAVRNFTWENGAQGGGIIIADNSTFSNCWRAVELNGYHDYSYGSAFSNTSNCSFNKVTFRIDEHAPFLASHNWTNGDLFTSFDTKAGVLIRNCNFINEIPMSMQSQAKRGRAIYFIATGAEISANTFDGFRVGTYITGYTGTPTRSAYIYDNTFTHITADITMAGSSYGDIRGNRIGDMYGLDPFYRSAAQPVGIYLDHTRGSYVGCQNQVDGTIGGNPYPLVKRFGTIVQHSYLSGAAVMDNVFSNLSVGTQTQLDNSHLNIGCNNYVANDLAWCINPQLPAIYLLQNQGTGCGSGYTRAGNKFDGNLRDIASYLSTPWSYYAYTGGGNYIQFPFNTTGNVSLTSCNGSTTTDPNSQCAKWWSCIRFRQQAEHLSIRKEYLDLVSAGLKYSPYAVSVKGEVIKSYNEEYDLPGLQSFLENENDDESYKLLIPLYIETGQYSKVSAAIGLLSLPTNEKNGYTDYYDILSTLQQQGRRPDALTAQELQTVQTIAQDDLEVTPFAKGLLEFGYQQEWEHPVEEEDYSGSVFKTVPGAGSNNNMSSMLYDAVPNPAVSKTMIGVFITQADAVQYPVLTVRNLMNKEVFRAQLKEGENKVEMNTADLAAGLYIYTLSTGNAIKESRKLSVIK